MTYDTIHRSTALTVLPYIDLSMDENGMMHVNLPNFFMSENGVIGMGEIYR